MGRIVFTIVIFGLWIVVACSTTETAVINGNLNKIAGVMTNFSPVPEPSGFVRPKTEQLTFDGINTEPSFSKDGARIIYQSKNRPDHASSQIYIMELASRHEHRFTFNAGEDSSPAFSPDGRFVLYASSMDEILEQRIADGGPAETAPQQEFSFGTNGNVEQNPSPQGSAAAVLAEASAAPTPASLHRYTMKKRLISGTELYLSLSDGSHIQRLTKSPGYDGEGSFSPDGRKIIFTSTRSHDPELYTLELHSKQLQRVTNLPGYDGQASFSPDGKWIIWQHWDAKEKAEDTNALYLSDRNGTRARKLNSLKARYWEPTWHPDGRHFVFSSDRDGTGNFELYYSDVEGKCVKRLTYSPGADFAPTFSPDGGKIAFASNRSGDHQLYLMDFAPPQNCDPKSL